MALNLPPYTAKEVIAVLLCLTVCAVPEQPNATLELRGRTTLAIRFRVMVR